MTESVNGTSGGSAVAESVNGSSADSALPPVDAGALDLPTRQALKAYVFAMADDELVMGHRDSEWTGLGPILEEDIAFSSMAQDEIGHAQVWYTLLHGLGEAEPDDLAFRRGAAEFRNARLCELPRGDYAISLVRQYLYDLAEAVRYDSLTASTWAPLAESAIKLRQEEKYHLIHGRVYLDRLARATPESRERMQSALNVLFPYALGLWEATEGEALLVERGIVSPSATLRATWLAVLVPFLHGTGLEVAAEREATGGATGNPGAGDGADKGQAVDGIRETSDGTGTHPVSGRVGYHPTVEPILGGRRGEHTADLVSMLDAMQALYRTDPEAHW